MTGTTSAVIGIGLLAALAMASRGEGSEPIPSRSGSGSGRSGGKTSKPSGGGGGVVPPSPPSGGGTSEGDRAEIELAQQMLNDFRQAVIEGERRIGARTIDPFPAIDRAGGGFEACSRAGALREDGVLGPCTRNALAVFDNVMKLIPAPLSLRGMSLSEVAELKDDPEAQRWLAQAFVTWHSTLSYT